jgi:hypothetical protein
MLPCVRAALSPTLAGGDCADSVRYFIHVPPNGLVPELEAFSARSRRHGLRCETSIETLLA